MLALRIGYVRESERERGIGKELRKSCVGGLERGAVSNKVQEFDAGTDESECAQYFCDQMW